MPLTYPAPPPTISGDTISIHQLLKTPTVLARRMATLAEQRFIADFLLKGRYNAVGGAILYPTGEPVTLTRNPEAIAPGGAFPKTTAGFGGLASAKTTKWGEDVPVTDEAISRLGMDPVNRALTQLVNTMVSTVDGVALGVIASAVTAEFSATTDGLGAWTGGTTAADDARCIIQSVLQAQAAMRDLGQGYDPTVIAMEGDQWAQTIATLIAAGFLPREAGNAVVTGDWPQTMGLTWVTSPHMPTSDPLLLDIERLGGMADEQIDSPGYARSAAGVGVETKSIRDEKHELYDLRARRVTVPVVVEAAAGVVIADTGL